MLNFMDIMKKQDFIVSCMNVRATDCWYTMHYQLIVYSNIECIYVAQKSCYYVFLIYSIDCLYSVFDEDTRE
jgi:hypothetical protein